MRWRTHARLYAARNRQVRQRLGREGAGGKGLADRKALDPGGPGRRRHPPLHRDQRPPVEAAQRLTPG